MCVLHLFISNTTEKNSHGTGHKHASFLILYILTLSTSKPRKLGVGYFEYHILEIDILINQKTIPVFL